MPTQLATKPEGPDKTGSWSQSFTKQPRATKERLRTHYAAVPKQLQDQVSPQTPVQLATTLVRLDTGQFVSTLTNPRCGRPVQSGQTDPCCRCPVVGRYAPLGSQKSLKPRNTLYTLPSEPQPGRKHIYHAHLQEKCTAPWGDHPTAGAHAQAHARAAVLFAVKQFGQRWRQH